MVINNQRMRASSSVSTEEGVSSLKNFKNIRAELSVGKLIGVLIFVVVAMALLPTVYDSITSGAVTDQTNGTASESLLPLIGVFYVLAIMIGVIMWVVHETKGGIK
jgi:hypothetical protein